MLAVLAVLGVRFGNYKEDLKHGVIGAHLIHVLEKTPFKQAARERFAEAQLQLRLVQEAHAATLVEHGTALRDAELRADSFARELHALKIWRAGAPGPLAEGMKDAVDEANALRAEERRSHLAQQARRIPPR